MTQTTGDTWRALGVPIGGDHKPQARGRTQREPGTMNKLEADYAAHLELRRTVGEIADWKYEAVKLQIAKRCWITVDFMVLLADGRVELHECKGFMEDDASVKLKAVAKEFWMFKFVLVKRTRGGFSERVIG